MDSVFQPILKTFWHHKEHFWSEPFFLFDMRLELTIVFWTFTLEGWHKVATGMSCPSLALGRRSFHNLVLFNNFIENYNVKQQAMNRLKDRSRIPDIDERDLPHYYCPSHLNIPDTAHSRPEGDRDSAQPMRGQGRVRWLARTNERPGPLGGGMTRLIRAGPGCGHQS